MSSRTSRDSGGSLPDVLAALILIGLVATAATGSLIAVGRAQSALMSRLDRAHAIAAVTSAFAKDARSNDGWVIGDDPSTPDVEVITFLSRGSQVARYVHRTLARTLTITRSGAPILVVGGLASDTSPVVEDIGSLLTLLVVFADGHRTSLSAPLGLGT